jgi:hypothetical protein
VALRPGGGIEDLHDSGVDRLPIVEGRAGDAEPVVNGDTRAEVRVSLQSSRRLQRLTDEIGRLAPGRILRQEA